MSVHTITGVRGEVFEVRWRPIDGPQRARRFKNREAAQDFDKGMRALTALHRAQQQWDALPFDLRQAVLDWHASHDGPRSASS
jgi:hypothetical protein